MPNVLRMSKFGRMGRWGNQLFQYMFLQTYARTHGMTVEIPAWVGNELYGFEDPPCGNTPCTRVVEKGEHGIDDTIIPHIPAPLQNADVEGWFQYHTSYYKPHEDYIRELFAEPSPDVRFRMRPIRDKLWSLGDTTVGLHFRRGDYGRNMFYITPVDWYVAWLREHYSRVPNPVIFVSTESLDVLTELKAKFPQARYETCESLGINLRDRPLVHYNYLPRDKRTHDPRQMDFFPDWYLLQQACDIILMPNSTFSFGAAMTSPRLRELWRSEPALQRFDRINPWHAFPAQFVKQKDFEHIPGLYLKSNPYW